MSQLRIVALILIALVPIVGRASSLADDPPPTLMIDSPLDYQVFQRATPTRGAVIVRGATSLPAGKIEYRLISRSPNSSVVSDWTPVNPDSAGHFLFTVQAPAGGWFRLELRVGAKDKAILEKAVEHLGVGEVFVIAGQSNSTNYGKPRQKPTSGKVSTFDGHAWRIADDPQPGTQDKSTGGSFIPSFGDAMVERYKVPIGVACVGFGGTSVREWLPKGDRMKQQPTTGKHVTPACENQWESTGQLFDGLMSRINQLGKNGFRAVLWHQGESDAGQARAGYPADRQITGDQYRAWLKRIIDQSQLQAGWQFPWFVAQATYHNEKDPSDEEFRSAQKSLWNNRTIFPGPDTDQLKADFRDGVHFNANGLAAHGKLWAEKVGNYLDPLVSQTPKPR